jgi:hypothetical protein
MSKKSRKRNKKILAAIGLGLGAMALSKRGKRNASIQANETKEAGFADTGKKFEDQSYSTGPKKDTGKKPDSKMPDNLSKNTGKDNKRPYSMEGKFTTVTTTDDSGKKTTKKLEPFKNSGLTLGVSERKVDKTANALAKAKRDTSAGKLPPQLQNPGRTNITTKQGGVRQGIKDFGNSLFPKANFKSGGRVKGCGKALRGFGKAMKGKR